MTTAVQVVKSVLSLLIVYALRGSLWCGISYTWIYGSVK